MKRSMEILHDVEHSRWTPMALGIFLMLCGFGEALELLDEPVSHLTWGVIGMGAIRVLQAAALMLRGLDISERAELRSERIPGWAQRLITFSAKRSVNLAVAVIMLAAGMVYLTQAIQSSEEQWFGRTDILGALSAGSLGMMTAWACLAGARRHLTGNVFKVDVHAVLAASGNSLSGTGHSGSPTTSESPRA